MGRRRLRYQRRWGGGGGMVPNRVVLADPVKPGDKFQIAIFGINGPISVAPMNFVSLREARIFFLR